MLFDGWLRSASPELLDIRGYRDGPDGAEIQSLFIAPVEELFYRTRVSGARVAVADGGGKEFDEAVAGALALGADNRRQRLEAGAHQRGRRHDLVGQQDRLLWHGL